ncbi:unnamed protein product [Schistocephalus solidus]|uniref:Uncharacterized protein n=1 Tax=Schistocephalus solidus TaxID=70667 RepID=A0A183SUM5_SCHSO|nr:unnamed protein product [Schistocephalus solidus]
MALPLRGIRARCGVTPRGGSGRASQMRPLPSPVVNAPVATSSWYPSLTCGTSKLVVPSGHTPGILHDRRAKPGEGVVCVLTPGTSVPFPLSRPTCPPPPLLFPAQSHLPSYFAYSPSSHPSFLLYFTLHPLPHPSLPLRSKKSYGEGDMQ